jgi:hypothetical protein
VSPGTWIPIGCGVAALLMASVSGVRTALIARRVKTRTDALKAWAEALQVRLAAATARISADAEALDPLIDRSRAATARICAAGETLKLPQAVLAVRVGAFALRALHRT